MATLSEHPAANIRAGGNVEGMPIELDRLSHNYGDRLALDPRDCHTSILVIAGRPLESRRHRDHERSCIRAEGGLAGEHQQDSKR